jgi:SnoaL-like domain
MQARREYAGLGRFWIGQDTHADHLRLRNTAPATSQENVEVVRKGIEAWNQHDADLWLSYAAPDIEWMPAGPAAVERTIYRGHDEVASGFEEAQIHDLGESVLWLGRVSRRCRGGNGFGFSHLSARPSGP